MVPPLRRGDGRNMLRPYGSGGGGEARAVQHPQLISVPAWALAPAVA